MVTFSQAQIDTFNDQEREMFMELAGKVNAQVEDEDFGSVVKAYLAKKAAKDADDEKYRKELEESFGGNAETRYY